MTPTDPPGLLWAIGATILACVFRLVWWVLSPPCEHQQVRCIHGDEIWSTQRLRDGAIARVRCLGCGRSLHGRPLPDICTVTGGQHHAPQPSPPH
jgi:hypothetical protein